VPVPSSTSRSGNVKISSTMLEGASLLADVRGRSAGRAHAAMVRRMNLELIAGARPLIERARDRREIDVDASVELLEIVWLARRAESDTFATGYDRVGTILLDLLRAAPPDPPGRRRPVSKGAR
jgi:hypothetical protein